MCKKYRIIILLIICVLFVLGLVLGIGYAFMSNKIDSSSVTEVSLSTCAKIKLTDTNKSISLNNSFPMSRNRGLNTTPYSFTVSSSCQGYIGFKIYLSVLKNSTMDAKNIHYAITLKGDKVPLFEGIVGEQTDGKNDFNNEEIKQLESGIKGSYSNIYVIMNWGLLNSNVKDYDLYLWVDESASNNTMNQVFNAGIALKAYETTFADICNETNSNTLACRVAKSYTTDDFLYYHDSNLLNGAQDYSYRFSGLDFEINPDYSSLYPTVFDIANVDCVANDDILSCIDLQIDHYYVLKYNNNIHFNSYRDAIMQAVADGYVKENFINNYVCFDTNDESCSVDNLYRIIGVFDDEIKLIKYDYKTDSYFGDALVNGGFFLLNSYIGFAKNKYIEVDGRPTWDGLRIEGYLSEKGPVYPTDEKFEINNNMVSEHKWYIGGLNNSNCYTAKEWYDNEFGINAPSNSYSTGQLGKIYVSEYFYTFPYDNWNDLSSGSWVNMGINDLTFSYVNDSLSLVYSIGGSGGINLVGEAFTSDYERYTFYLKSPVTYVSGTGSLNDPYRIKY